MTIPAFLSEPPVERGLGHPITRIAFLIAYLFFLAINLWLWATTAGNALLGQTRVNGMLLAVMLLLNHLAFAFRWPRGMTIFFRLSAIALIATSFGVLLPQLVTSA